MPEIIPVDSPEDPRIADFQALKERELAAAVFLYHVTWI